MFKKRVLGGLLAALLLASMFVLPATAAPKPDPTPKPAPISLGNGVTLYPDGTAPKTNGGGNSGGGGGITPQSNRTIKITTYMYGCTSLFNPFFNPTGCIPLVNAYWQWKYAGALYWSGGTGTDSNGLGTMYVPVTTGSTGTIWFLGYGNFQCQTNWYTTGDPATCVLYSIRTP